MFTAAYLANRTPHSALNMATSYKDLHGKEATLQHLRTIGSRAFVHIEAHTRKLEDRSWEGRLCGYSQDTKAYRICNAKTNKVVESRNVVFTETPSKLASPPTNESDNINKMDNIGSRKQRHCLRGRRRPTQRKQRWRRSKEKGERTWGKGPG